MSQAEIAMRSENDASLLKGWNKRKGKGGRVGIILYFPTRKMIY